MKQKIIFLHYGEGGHRAEIERLYALLDVGEDNVQYIGLCEGKHSSKKLKNHKLFPMRNKNSKVITIILFPFVVLYNFIKIMFIMIRYNPVGLISTGPGSVLIPAVIFRLFHKKIVYIETGCHFYSKSLSGKYMQRIANKFYIQNKELLDQYPVGIYGGML